MRRILDMARARRAAQGDDHVENAAPAPVGQAEEAVNRRNRARAGLPNAVGANQPRPAAMQSFVDKLYQWVHRSPVAEANARVEVQQAIHNILAGRTTKLVIEQQSLTSLPDLPFGLTEMKIRANKVTALPQLPPTLTDLSVSARDLVILPTLPIQIKRLDVVSDRLESLRALPEGLVTLNLSTLKLRALPELPASLAALKVTLHPRAGLPLNIGNSPNVQNNCAEVKHWQAINAQQARGNARAAGGYANARPAPQPRQRQNIEQAGRLNARAVPNRPVTTLAELVNAGLVNPAVIDGFEHMLPSEALEAQAIHDQRLAEQERNRALEGEHGRAAAENAARAEINPRGAERPAPIQPANVAAQSNRARGTAGWKVPAVSNATGNTVTARDFHNFLHRLKGGDIVRGHREYVAPAEYTNPVSRPAFIARVDALLDAMEHSPPLRAVCLTIAQGASASCGDRISLALNDMENAHINDDARLGRYSDVELYKMGQGLFRLDLVEQMATLSIAAQEEALPEDQVDPVEIRLALQTELAQRLDLPGVGHAMHYAGYANFTPESIDMAAVAVSDRERRTGGVEFLAKWQPWQEAMKRQAPDAFRRMEEAVEADQEHYAVMPDVITDQAQRHLYNQIELQKITSVENFTRTQTVRFITANEHLLGQ